MKKIYLHPKPVRLWHWINAISFLVLIITGAQIRYRDIIYLTSFENAVNIHNYFGFVLIGNYFIWLLYYITTGKIRLYLPEFNPRKLIEGSIRQAKYYGHGIFMGADNPHHPTSDNKFNPLQKTAYLAIMILLIPIQLITGLLIWDIKLFEDEINLAGGLRLMNSIHVLLFFFFTSFLFIHIYLATLGHTAFAHIKAMFTGYEEMEDDHGHRAVE